MSNKYENAVRVLSLNLRFGLADDGQNNWARRRHAYVPLIQQFPCDFYSFQEANDFQIAFLADLLPEYDCIGRRSPSPSFWQNNVIFYHKRWQCRMKDHFYLSPTPLIPSRFRRSRWPRQCTWGLFRLNHRAITCINTHFDFLPEIQVQSARIIMRQLHDRRSSESAILMGDFNAEPESACYGVFTSPEVMGMSPFHHAFKPPYMATHHNFSGCGKGPQIDWILYRGDVQLTSAKIVTDQFDGCYPSDHFALSAEFLI